MHSEAYLLTLADPPCNAYFDRVNGRRPGISAGQQVNYLFACLFFYIEVSWFYRYCCRLMVVAVVVVFVFCLFVCLFVCFFVLFCFVVFLFCFLVLLFVSFCFKLFHVRCHFKIPASLLSENPILRSAKVSGVFIIMLHTLHW